MRRGAKDWLAAHDARRAPGGRPLRRLSTRRLPGSGLSVLEGGMAGNRRRSPPWREVGLNPAAADPIGGRDTAIPESRTTLPVVSALTGHCSEDGLSAATRRA